MVADLSQIPHSFPRRYVPSAIRFEWEDISKVFGELSAREVTDPSQLERWLLDEAEFDAYLYEQKALRYIDSTRQTDNAEYSGAFERYTKELEPKIKVAKFGLLKKYVASPHRRGLPKEVYGLEDRRREAAISTFRVENVDLERDESGLSQEQQKVTGGMSVTFRGEERTLQQMGKFLEATDRATREEAWRTAARRRLKDRDALDGIYDRMVGIRAEVAKNAGFDDYVQYTYLKKARFDYAPSDCIAFQEATEKHIVPLSREIDRARQERLGVAELRPWDLYVDPDGRAPLAPFEETEGLVSGTRKVLGQVDGQLEGYFSKMADVGLLDLESRKGKAPGGYEEELTEARLPFIFMNAARRDGDIRTLLHESGHSFHTFLMRDGGLPYFNAAAGLTTEFAEVASTSMEIISGEHYEGAFYDREGASRSNWQEAAMNVKLFTWVATIDAFQHWVYAHPEHSRDERSNAWVEIFSRFGGLEGYQGLEEERACMWQKQLHLFESPLYYIEYAIALTGALGVWSRYRKNRRDAIEAYKGALSLGATKSLPELFEAAGVEWGFGGAAMGRCADALRAAIKEYA